MGFFSRRSKSVRKDEAPASAKKEAEARPQSSRGQPPAKQQTMAQKSRSVPTSRRTSFSSRDPGFTSHPAYAQNNIIPVNSATQSYLPVPQVPAEKKRDRASSTKAGKLLGVKTMPSAPSSPQLSPQGFEEPDKQAGSRHDSVNSNVDAPRIGKLGSEQMNMSFAEEMAMEPAFSDEMDTAQKRRSISSIGYRHSRDISHDSFRPTNNRRHTLHQAPQGFSLSREDSQRETMSRGRSHQSIPSYSMPTNASRSYQAEHERHASRRSEVSIMAPFAGAYQPRTSSLSREQYAASSPTLRPHRHTVYAEDAMSIRSFTQPPPMTRQSLQRQSSMGPPALSILDGLKVNRRGKILDEEGEMIGELVDGDIIDCVRQKANAYGEVIDEYGRVVGRVQTLPGGMGVATPSLHMGSPAVVTDRDADYFSIHQSSPMLAPVMDAQAMQRRMQEDSQQKYRMLMDIPPVPSMPAHYQGATNSPILNARRHTLATLEQYDTSHCVELPAEELASPVDDELASPVDHDVPIFDLSEPFMPKHKRMKTPPKVEAPATQGPSPQQARRSSMSAKPEVKAPLVVPVAVPVRPVATPSISSASESSVSSNASSVSAISSLASSISVASTQEDEEEDDDDDDCFLDAETHAQPVQTIAKLAAEAKPQPTAAPPSAAAQMQAPAPALEEEEPSLEMIGRAIEQPAPQTYRPSQPVPESKQIRPVRHGVSMHPRVIVPVSQLTQQTITEDAAESPLVRPITAVNVQPEMARPTLSSRARTAPSPVTATNITAVPPMPRPDTMSELVPSASTSGYNSAEDSSEGEGLEVKRKEVRISNLPPTTIPNRGLTRSMSDGAGLSRMTAMPSMPSVPESAPLPDTPRTVGAPMPRPFGMQRLGARNAAPLPNFPRQNFSGLPPNPFAAANAASMKTSNLQKRNTMPARPGAPPPLPRSALARVHKFGLNAPLVPSPLAGKASSIISSEESTPFGSDCGRDGRQSDAVSIISTLSGAPTKRTFFTHAGRVTVEAGDLPPSAMKDEVVVAVTERPDTSGSKSDSIKKRRFSLKLGGRKSKNAPAVAAH